MAASIGALVLGLVFGVWGTLLVYANEDETRAWAAAAYGDFDATTVSGTDHTTFDLPEGATTGIIAVQYAGTGDLSVNLFGHEDDPDPTESVSTSTGRTVLDVEGPYTGSILFEPQYSSADTVTSVTVVAQGDFEVTVAPVSDAPELPASGTGDGVFLSDGPARQLELTWTDDSMDAEQRPSALPPELAESGTTEVSSGGDTASPATWEFAEGPALVIIDTEGEWEVSGL